MTNMHLPRRHESALLVIDVQQRLAAAMPPRHVQGNVQRMAKLIAAARRMEIPVITTEQYPRGLGATLPVLGEALGDDATVIEKTEFDCTLNTDVAEALNRLDRRQIVAIGMETHICVTQSALGLVDASYRPFVVADAVLSRFSEDHRAGLDLLRSAQVPVVTFEMVLFAWMRQAGTPEFKDLSYLARDRDE